MGQEYNGKAFFVCTTSILVGAGSLWSQAQYYHLTNDLTTENNLPLNNSTFQFGFPCAKCHMHLQIFQQTKFYSDIV
jgi:hypothetical protein